jgi:ATP/ADP translocase
MAIWRRFYDWLDFRPEEARALWLSFFGAFLIVGYMILARSLREALYLDAFDIKTLPYITLAVVILGFPTASLFSFFLSRHSTQQVLKVVVLIVLGGLALLWPISHFHRLPIILFYIWTSLAALVLTAGFWIVVSEHFPIRGAKRLYGMISGGGTAGALIIGTALGPLTKSIPVFGLVPLVMSLLFLFWLILLFLPKVAEAKEEKPDEKPSFREQIELVWKSPHLYAIAVIVVTATLASQLLDFQFKEFVKAGLKDKAAMAGFFGAFYGWTGGIALTIQILLASRLLSKLGIAWTLSILPVILLVAGGCLLFIPSLYFATGFRGLDNSVRKSLHRSAIEVLYVPVPSLLRRKTKTFIDSVLDSTAEGLAALLVFFVVTWGDIPSRYLSFFILASAGVFLLQAMKMDRRYYKTLVQRLKEGEEEAAAGYAEESRYGQDLLDASFSSVDLRKSLEKRGIVFQESPSQRAPKPAPTKAAGGDKDLLSTLSSNEPEKIRQALEAESNWEPAHVPGLVRLLVRDNLYPQASQTLVKMGESSVDALVQNLNDENNDFVIRRRIPKILAKLDSVKAEEALLDALLIERFEVRYRAAIALMKRSQSNFKRLPAEEEKERLWKAIRFEVNHEKPVWEMQQILDELNEDERDDFPPHVEARGELSLEHVFRMLALIFDGRLIRTAYQGLQLEDAKLKSFALEYLEQILPDDVKEKLWLFIGDVSESRKRKAQRPLEEVARELMETGATLFVDKKTREKLKVALKKAQKE